MNSDKSYFYVSDDGNLIDIDGNLIDVNGELISDEISLQDEEEMNEIYKELEKSISELDIDDTDKEEMLERARLFMQESKETVMIIYELNKELLSDYRSLRITDDRIPDLDGNGLLTAITLLLMGSKFAGRIQEILDKNDK